jgi:4,5-DOPA dioxygenase extradiol
MKRKDFLKSIIGLSSMTTLGSFQHLTADWKAQDVPMPVLFIGHGSPMNAIEDNEFTRGWKNMLMYVPKPKAILMVSAHWETKGTFVTALQKPQTIHDFGGFPQKLFEVQYPANGSTWLAEETQRVIQSAPVGLDTTWGLDHGAWSVLRHLYPEADVPVVQLSLDYTKNTAYHYDLAKQLQGLRQKGVLIIGSGNMVHNFQYAQIRGDFNTHFGHDWAIEANESFKKLILENNYKDLIDFEKYSTALRLAAPTPDHYLPMLYAIALRESKENVAFFNDAVIGGSFSMTSLKIG